jgi:membrane-associated protease RseP (regulator of RpoE activity)
MLGPYRTLVEADPAPVRCTANPHDGRPFGACCTVTVSPPPRFPALLPYAIGELAHPSAAGYPRLVSLAATLLLFVASASLGAIGWSVLVVQLGARVQRTDVVIPQTAAPAPVAAAHVALHADAPQRVRQVSPPPPPRPAPAAVPTPRAPRLSLARLGPETHAADELWRRAERLAATGADVTLVHTTLARQPEPLAGSGVRIVHEQGPDGSVGVRIVDVGKRSSPPALAGLETGDRVLAVNGFPLADPGDIQRAFAAIGAARALVLEMVRNGRTVALRVDWRG